MATLEDKSLWENQEADDEVEQEIRRLAPEEINNRTRLLENDIKVLTRDLHAHGHVFNSPYDTRS